MVGGVAATLGAAGAGAGVVSGWLCGLTWGAAAMLGVGDWGLTVGRVLGAGAGAGLDCCRVEGFDWRWAMTGLVAGAGVALATAALGTMNGRWV